MGGHLGSLQEAPFNLPHATMGLEHLGAAGGMDTQHTGLTSTSMGLDSGQLGTLVASGDGEWKMDQYDFDPFHMQLKPPAEAPPAVKQEQQAARGVRRPLEGGLPGEGDEYAGQMSTELSGSPKGVQISNSQGGTAGGSNGAKQPRPRARQAPRC